MGQNKKAKGSRAGRVPANHRGKKSHSNQSYFRGCKRVLQPDDAG
jgi:hypothetical protein